MAKRRTSSPPASFGPAELEALRGAPLADLRAEWGQLFGNTPPGSLRRDLLVRAIAYQRQVAIHGGLSRRTRKTLMRIAKLAETTGFTPADVPRYLAPGTRLVRAWKGVTHTVEVLPEAFAWNGERFTSLSAIARAITGTSWNGNAFFGLRPRKSRRRASAGDTPALSAQRHDTMEMVDG